MKQGPSRAAFSKGDVTLSLAHAHLAPPRWSDETLKCRELFTTYRPATSSHIGKPPAEPMHIILRFSGRSRHDQPNQHTPRQGAASFVLGLQQIQPSQRPVTAVSVLLNGPAAGSASIARWFEEQLRGIPLRRSEVRTIRHGNAESFTDLLDLVMKLPSRTIVYCVEEDYLYHPEVFARTASFFHDWNPCAITPSNFASYYSGTDPWTRFFYHRNIVLPSPSHRSWWRTVDSTTVTFAARVHVLKDLVRLGGNAALPGPYGDGYRGDRDPSLFIGAWLGIFAPLPGLASHRHLDDGQGGNKFHAADFDAASIISAAESFAKSTALPINV